MRGMARTGGVVNAPRWCSGQAMPNGSADICSHAYAHLSDGYVDGDTVECPLHQGLFHIPTGKAMAPPVTQDIATYPVRIQGDDVLIDLAGE